MKKLPIGIQSFEQITKGEYIYLDKTQHIYNLIESGKYYFLSRPRRFGKSLLVSILRCLFEGKKDLFKGLWIEDKWEWKKHPVIVIDFNQIVMDTPENLQTSLCNNLSDIGKAYKLRLEKHLLKEKFRELILGLKEEIGNDVVILIDEYDKPIIDHIGRGKERLETAQANRDILKSFYGVIKGADAANVTRFVLLTGVSKFSRVSIFSELNNLADITMDARYCTMLGITEEELESYFAEHIENIAAKHEIKKEEVIEKLRTYYNGYRFSGEDAKVYNPFSILRCFDEGEFKHYWFETGTPTFLVNLIKENSYYVPEIEKLELMDTDFSTYEIERLNINAILFQTGYITIKDIVDIEQNVYRLGYPNLEVKKSFMEVLFCEYTGATSTMPFVKILNALKKGETETFIEIIRSLFAGIACSVGAMLNEAYFHSLFYVMVSGAGVFTYSEILTSEGRIDLVVELSNGIYIMEFKCNQSSKTAIAQIKKKRYADRYLQTGKDIHLVGINFSTEKRNIGDWQTEKVIQIASYKKPHEI